MIIDKELFDDYLQRCAKYQIKNYLMNVFVRVMELAEFA